MVKAMEGRRREASKSVAPESGREQGSAGATVLKDEKLLTPASREASGAPVIEARFGIGDVVRHRRFPFRGVVFDVDPEYANTEEWWEAIPADLRPDRNQPFYHLFAENGESAYIAYVSQQNLEEDSDHSPVFHPAIKQVFDSFRNGRYILRPAIRN